MPVIRIDQILCPVDFSEISQHAVDHAAAIARWYRAKLTLLHVFANLPTMDVPPLELEDADRERLAAATRSMAARVPAEVSVDVRVEQAQHVHDEILGQLAATRADLLVIGTHGRSGFERLFLGSVTEKVIRRAAAPVLVVPPRAPDVAPDAPVQFRRIVCAVDFSDSSVSAVGLALSLAQEADAHLTLLHVLELPPELREHALIAGVDVDGVRASAEAETRKRLRELVPAEAATYCTVETAVAEGRAYRQVLHQAADERADLIVMGVQGRGAMDLLMFGSTAHHVIRSAMCPVLIVRGT